MVRVRWECSKRRENDELASRRRQDRSPTPEASQPPSHSSRLGCGADASRFTTAQSSTLPVVGDVLSPPRSRYGRGGSSPLPKQVVNHPFPTAATHSPRQLSDHGRVMKGRRNASGHLALLRVGDEDVPAAVHGQVERIVELPESIRRNSAADVASWVVTLGLGPGWVDVARTQSTGTPPAVGR